MALSFDQLRKKYAEVLSRPVSRGLSTLGNNVKTSTSNFVRNPGQSAKTIGKELWRIPQDAAYGVGSMPAFHTRTVPYARKEAERLSNRSLDLQKEVQRAQELGNYKLARQLMDRSNSAKKQAQWTERVVTNMPTIKDWIKGNQKEPSLRMDAFTKGVTSGARTALTGKGLQNPAMVAKALPLSVGLSGGITALSGGDLAQGIGSGITAAPRAVGLNSLTQPYFDKLMPKTLSGLKATGTKFAVGAGTNLAEDQAYTLATEGRLPSAGENVFSIVLGGVTGTAYKQPDGRVEVEFPDKSTLTWNEKLQRYQDSGGRMAKKAVEWVGEQREQLGEEIQIPVTNKLTGETYYIKTTRGQQGFVKPDELIPGAKPQSVADKNLIAQHNIKPEGVLHAEKMGGLPLPSIAIARKEYPLENFGDISLLGGRQLYDPQIKSNKVYNADAYTPRYPTVNYTIIDKAANERLTPIINEARKYFGKNTNVVPSYIDNYGSPYRAILESGDFERNGIGALENNSLIKGYFAKTKGARPDSDYTQINRIIEKHRNEYTEFVEDLFDNISGEERLFKGFTNAGNRRYAPHTLDNVVKEMKASMKEGEGFNYGLGTVRSKVAKKYNKLSDIKADRDKILPAKEFEKVKKELDNEWDSILNEAVSKSDRGDEFGEMDRFSSALIDGIRRGNIKSELEEYGFRGMDIERLGKFLDKVRNAPTEYFEVKPQRAVGLNEFRVATVPEDTPTRVIESLKKQGIKIYKYTEKNRSEVIQRAADENELAFGAVAGIEVYQDENGEYKVRYNTENALMGMALMAGVKHGGKYLKNVTQAPKPQSRVGEIKLQPGEMRYGNKIVNKTEKELIGGFGGEIAKLQSRGAKMDNYQRLIERYEVSPTPKLEAKIRQLEKSLGYTQSFVDMNKSKNVAQAPVDDTLNLVRQAIDSGDEEAAKSLYQSIEGQKPTFQSLVDEVMGVQEQALKEVKKISQKDYGEYQDVVNKFRTYLKRSGESTNETGMLNREHIPASKFGVGSDTVATDLGMSETEFMSQITKDLDMAGKGTATPQQLARLDNSVKKIKNLVTKLGLDKDFYKINKDELGRNLGVTALPGGQKSPKTLRKVTQRVELVAKKEFDDWQRAVVSQSGGGRTTRQAIDVIARNIEQNTGGAGDLSNAKDISNLSKGFNTVYRNFQRVFGDKYPQVKSRVLDPFDKSKGKHVDDLEKEAGSLYKNIVQGLGIKKGSKESAAVQLFGEGKKSYDDLVKEFGQQKADNIVQADKWFRSQYDRLLSEVNLVRKRIYPNNPDKIIPKRKDYYRHFREMREGFGALLNIFDSPGNIAPGLESISENTKPRSKWLSFAQKRIGERTDVDAVGGFLDYIRSSSYAKNIDPHIQVFRGLRDDLVKATSDVKDPNYGRVNNFINFLDKYANDLSGKTNQADRVFQEIVPGGRRTFSALNWLNNRVKANVILGNVSSSLAQILNLPQGVASAGRYNMPGLGRTMTEMFTDNKAIKQSDFIKERYAGDVFNKFDTGMLKNTKKFAVWMTQALDEIATKYIWNAHYEKALREGVGNPVKYADDITRNLVGGRGIGEAPLMQKARTFQFVAPFQLEVGNFWYVMKDMVDNKQFGKLATLFVMTHVMNRGLEAIRGSGGAFDPIQAMIDMYDISQEEDGENKAVRMAGRGAGEILSNVPLGQSVAGAYPEYGFKVGDTQLPTREELFGDADPTRFGSGLLAMKGIQDPLYKVLPPFGGNQLKKSITGAQAYNQGYSETKSGRVRFPIEQNPTNLAKSVAFGEYSTKDAREYFDKDTTPLGDNQSQTFKKLLMSSPSRALDYYNSIMGRRGDGEAKDIAMATMQVYANEGNKLPAETEMLGVLYNKAKGVVDGYEEDRLLIENDPTLDYDERVDKLDELDAKYQGWNSVVSRIEQERPEQVLTLEVNQHVSGGGKTTEERAKWVYDTLTSMPQGQKKVDLAKRLLDEKVITKSVYEELEKTYDLKLPAYKEGSTIKVRKSGGKKPKKLPKDLFKAVKLVKPKSSGSSIKVRKLSRKKPTRVSLKPKKVVAISPI